MSDPMKQAWSEVAEGFTRLGGAMKDRYHGEPDEPVTTGPESPGGPEELRDAFQRLVEAGRDVGQRSIDVLRDADVNAQARQAASSLNDAIAATVDMIGNEVNRWFSRPAAEPGESPTAAPVEAEAHDVAVDDRPVDDPDGSAAQHDGTGDGRPPV